MLFGPFPCSPKSAPVEPPAGSGFIVIRVDVSKLDPGGICLMRISKHIFFPDRTRQENFHTNIQWRKVELWVEKPSVQTVMNLNLFCFVYVFLALIFQSHFSFHSFNLLLVVLLDFDIFIFVQTAFEILSCSVSNTR